MATRGSKSGLLVTFQLPKEHHLSRYLLSLAAHKDQFLSLTAGQVVQLDPAATFPLTALSQLVVRRCYLDLLEADARYRQLHPPTTVTYMTGTNGCGKSCCAAIHMSKLLAKGKTVIFEGCGGQRDTCQLFKLRLGEPVTMASDSEAFAIELTDADVCYIVDGCVPSARYFHVSSCWAYTSPRGMSSRRLKYVFAFSHVLKMPCFSLDELQQLRQAVDLYRDRVPEHWVPTFHHLAGGNASLVLQLPAFKGLELRGVESFLRRESFGRDSGQIQAMHVHGSHVGFDTNACDCLLQWEVLDAEDEPPPCDSGSSGPEEAGLRRFQRHRLQFASAFVAALVARHQTLDMRQLCTRVTQDGTAAMAGSQFEQLVHSTLPNMPAGAAQLKLRLLASGKEFLLQLQASEPWVFYSAAEAADLACPDCATYLMPCSGAHAAVDCLMSRKLLLQVAPGSSHTICRAGLEELCAAVKADEAKFAAAHAALEKMLSAVGRRNKHPLKDLNLPLLVFVTPESQYQKWKGLQQYTDPQPQAPLVEQAVMCFPTAWAVEGFTLRC